MGPHQIFPFDEWGARQFLYPDGSALHKDSRAPGELSVVAGGAPKSPFVDQSKITSTPDVDECDNFCFSDVEDALDDDDDDEGVGLDNNWPRREFTPKRGVEIFVGGLTRSTRRNMLQDWFQHAGEVTEVRIARDKRRRRCRGYGYVRFSTSEQANRAIETMHRFEFKHGRFLGVLPSDENRTLFVGGLREEWSCRYITDLLKEMMPGLRKVEPIPDREDRLKIRTFCFLEFDTHEEAAAIFNRHHVDPPPAQEQQRQLGHPSRDSLCQEKTSLSSCAANTPQGRASVFERETRINSGGTANISCSSGCVGEGPEGSSSGGCGSLGIPEGAESSIDCLTPTAASLTPSANVASARLATGEALPADVEGLLGDLYNGNDGGWWQRSMEDPGGGDGNVESASSHGTTPQPAIGGETHATWEDPVNRNAKGVHSSGNNGVPLVVDGAMLKVDWADPLRYHIHLNGGIKGPSAPPGEVGMADGRSIMSHGTSTSSSARRVIPIGVHGRASYGQGPWQVPQQLPMLPGTRGGGLSETSHAPARRMECDQLRQQRQHQAQHPAHPLYEQQHGTHRAEFPSGHHSRSPQHHNGSYSGQSAASQSVTTAGDRGYGISDQRVSDASPLYCDGAPYLPLHGRGQQKQQEDFDHRARTAQHLFPRSQHYPQPDQEPVVRRAPQQPPDIANVRRLRQPSVHEQQHQLRAAYSDRPASVPFDNRSRNADVGWRLVRDVDTQSSGGSLSAGGTASYSVAPEAPGYQDTFSGAALGNGGGGFSKMRAFSKTHIRPDVSPAARRGSLPQAWRAAPTGPSSWDRRMVNHRAPLADAMAACRLDPGEQEAFAERRGDGDGRVAEGYHLGSARSMVEGTKGYAGGHGAQQRQQNYNQYQQRLHQCWEQGWASEVGDHGRRHESGSMIDQVRESSVTNRGQLSVSESGHPRLLSMFDHGSEHYSTPLSLHEQQRREQREHLSSGGMLIPDAQPFSQISGIVDLNRSVVERERRWDTHIKQQQAPPGFSTSLSCSSMAAAEPSVAYPSNGDRWAKGDVNGDGAWHRGLGRGVDISPRNDSSNSSSSSSSSSGVNRTPEMRGQMDRDWNPLTDVGRVGGVNSGADVPSRESFGSGLWEGHWGRGTGL